MVPRQLGEQLLELEADIKQMYEKHKEAESERKEMADADADVDIRQMYAKHKKEAESEQKEKDLTNLRGEVADQKDDDKKAEVVLDLVDDLDVKEEQEVKVEVEMNQMGDAEEVGMAEKEQDEGDLVNLTPLVEEESKGESKKDIKVEDIEGARKDLRKTEKCDICEKMFKRKCELERHKVMHSKVYLAPSCPFCGKLLKGSIKRHILSNHPDRKDEVLFLPLLFLFKFKLRLLMCWVRSATASGIKAWRRQKSSPCPGTYHSRSPTSFHFQIFPQVHIWVIRKV